MPVATAEEARRLGTPEEVREAARRLLAAQFFLDFITYTFPGYHVGPVQRLLAGKLEAFEQAVAERRSPRLMIFLPPRSGKSEAVSRRFPPWVLGRHPDWSIILATYGAELSEELSGDARAIVMSEEFANVFGRQATEDLTEAVELDRARKSVQAWRIARKRGGMRATGVGGAITGRGADVLILDDLIKSRKEADSDGVREDTWNWYRSTARTRMEPGGGIVFLSTRWHHDDPAGRLLTRMREDPNADQWEVISLPAIADENDMLGRQPGAPLDPVRFGLEALAKIKADVGTREWNALYQQRPTPQEGSIFKDHWFVRADPPTQKPIAIYQFWDTAFTRKKRSDRSVCGTWKVYPDRFRLEDVFFGRLELPQVKAEAKRLADLYRPRAVVIEDEGSSGKVLLQEWRHESQLPIMGYPSRKDGDKVARANAVTPTLEAGKVEIPHEAPWLRLFLEEVLNFPEWEHDDMVDMLSMALTCMAVKSPGTRKLSSLRDFKVVR